jgi:oligopeptide transport system permease protein
VLPFLARRALQMVVAFFGTTLLVYALMCRITSDPLQALAGERPLSPSQRAQLTAQYHLDEPFLVQYGYYMRGLLTGDLGRTLTGRPIGDVMSDAWPNTIKLALLALFFATLFGIAAGLVAGLRRGSVFDNTTLALTLVVVGLPIIVLAPIAQLIFGVKLGWFPTTAGARPSLYGLILPALVLGAASTATVMRLTRASVAENVRADYVRTARAKGLSARRVVGVHVLRNSLIPVITLIGVDLGTLMAGAIVTEGVFNIPGVGSKLLLGIQTEDGPLVVGFVSVLVIVFLVSNLLVDLLYAVLDPRIRYE